MMQRCDDIMLATMHVGSNARPVAAFLELFKSD